MKHKSKEKKNRRRADPGRLLSSAVTIFYAVAFLLLFVRACFLHGVGTAFAEHWQGLALAAAVPLLNPQPLPPIQSSLRWRALWRKLSTRSWRRTLLNLWVAPCPST